MANEEREQMSEERLRVRVYLTPEESVYVQDNMIDEALAMARAAGRDGDPLFCARVVRNALRKGLWR